MIELYGISSPNVLKVMLMLEEVGQPYVLHRIDIWGQDQFTPEFRALNPNCKVPVIVDPDGPGGEPITVFESGAILTYLAERHGTPGQLLPLGLRERTTVMQWLMWQMGSVGPMFGQSNHFRLSATEKLDYAISRYVTEVKRLYDVLEVRLGESEWLGGADYSVADIATWPWAGFYVEANGVDMAALPAVSRWLEAVKARPATRRVMAEWKGLMAYGTDRRATAEDDGRDRLFGRGRYARA